MFWTSSPIKIIRTQKRGWSIIFFGPPTRIRLQFPETDLAREVIQYRKANTFFVQFHPLAERDYHCRQHSATSSTFRFSVTVSSNNHGCNVDHLPAIEGEVKMFLWATTLNSQTVIILTISDKNKNYGFEKNNWSSGFPSKRYRSNFRQLALPMHECRRKNNGLLNFPLNEK